MEHRYLTVEETAELFRLKKSTIRKWLFLGIVPKVKMGRRVFIPKEWALDFIAQNTHVHNLRR